ncbi:MAG: ABC transporter ATP-binding protein [Anaerolineae bacterium]|nr:ABC transporter ATP-binding protein [Anaerolineae bacterium]
MSFLTVNNLTKSYGDQKVLDDISFEIENGTFLSLLGPSGCGKTTTLRIIAGFIQPDAGEVLINGQVINHIPIHKRNIGMVFQSYALFPHMSVEQNVAYGLEQRGMAAADIKRETGQALEMVKLIGFEKRKPGQLSGGQQQRVALARALVIKPTLLLLDESLSALDKNLRVEMQVELRSIQKMTGITAIFVTHDQEEALTLSDKIAVLNHGQIVQVDTPENIYEHPANSFVAGFLGKANFFEGRVAEIRDGLCRFELTNGEILIFDYTGPASAGETYTLTVRPEKMRLLPAGERNDGISGIVRVVTYAGNLTLYRVEAAGQTLEVQMQNAGGHASFHAGETAQLAWDRSSCLLLH